MAAERQAKEESDAQRKAAARQEIEDGNSPLLLDYLAKWPDGAEEPQVFVALQRAAANESVDAGGEEKGRDHEVDLGALMKLEEVHSLVLPERAITSAPRMATRSTSEMSSNGRL